MLVIRISNINWLGTIQIPGFCGISAVADYRLLFTCLFFIFNLWCLFIIMFYSGKIMISTVPSTYVHSYCISSMNMEWVHILCWIIDILKGIILNNYNFQHLALQGSSSRAVFNNIFVSVSVLLIFIIVIF